MEMRRIRNSVLAAGALLALALWSAPSSAQMPAGAQAAAEAVQTIWRMADYVAVDYSGAVVGGRVSSESEYAEQVEFAATIAQKLAQLPERPGRGRLIESAGKLQAAIAAKADSAQVASLAHTLADALLATYPVPLAPSRAPDLARGATLYAQNCMACHGAAGDGHGPAAAAFATPPIAFSDAARARQRSLFALYQVVTQGLDGTPMKSFAGLPSADRWALAFYAGHFAFPDQLADQGEQLWKSNASLRAAIPNLQALVVTNPQTLEARLGSQQADALIAYLRRHPELLSPPAPGALHLARTRLSASLDAYRAGNTSQAAALALSAYLDGFESVEPALGARDNALMGHIERVMGEYRAAIEHRASPETLTHQMQVIDNLLDDAEAALSSGAGNDVSTFVGAATILLREGLEALLIVVAMIAFLRKAQRVEVMPHVHAGWVGALIAGLLTWAAATWLIGISGASRELTEGFGSVFAALVLLSVGIWMHGKAQANQWQRYIREKMSTALSGRSAWLLFGLAFIVVYREVFETVLFYAALWSQGNGIAMLLGAASACLALALIAWAMLRYSRALPIGKFFNYSSWLMAILTVVLAGKGIAALQEAGFVGIQPLADVPRLSMIGLFPTLETLVAQALMLIALIVGFRWNRQKAARVMPARG